MQNWLTKRVDLSPQQTALVVDDQRLTFEELQTEVLSLAEQLAMVLDDNPRVGLLTNNSKVGYELILALQQLGRQVVLLNNRLSSVELAYQLQDARVSQVLMDDNASQVLSDVTTITFSEILSAGHQAVVPIDNFDLDAVTTIMYTSGTTGKPKGVQQTFGNHFYSAIGSMLNLGLSADDSWLATVPIFHISGLSIMMRSLIYGIPVYLFERFDAPKIHACLMQGMVTTISVVPTMLKELLAQLSTGERYPVHFKTMLLGGGPTDLKTLKQAQAAGVNIVQSYGMTETASQIIALDPKDAKRKVGSVGKPLFPVELKIKNPDEHGIGRVQVKSPTLTVGYLNQAQKYEDSFDDGWFDTGDMGYLDDEQFLFLAGREGDMISSGGENIFPDEVEAVYRELPAVKEIAVVGVPDERWGQQPVAIVELADYQHISAAELQAYGRSQIAHYKVPRHFYQLVDDWPKTASGKIQRFQLRQQLSQLSELD
ncbi:O-succinylbenzoic acid--CoA ligase [Weissella uvarum]|uniref:o-succinylbenzoate--CoA ligase n=1 Tax=Weissella uvarum TaxID=1479233 RepID=UPI001962050B|nr:o-succinylbenzoate--CoA ligase [Weissella uvarum]MBM7616885.1 O-succinylbenzoic acid--CoA ligase [Weissella uvarum]MCM0594663.1 o-succinylbenzoate--CoA ligase [Weissella uvarum]